MKKEDIVQAIVIADTFDDEFVPITNDIPFSLLPILNRPLIDYTLDFLSLGGVEETFLFCCAHVDMIKSHIKKSIQNSAEWSLTMKVNIIVSESCRSFGDCLRDIDAKGLLRGNFVLVEPGTISNIKLLPLIKKHNDVTNKDKGAAMTLIFQEAGIGHHGRCPSEEVFMACNRNNRVLFHKKLGLFQERKTQFPLEIFLENPLVSLHHDLRDTHVAICSPAVLPLFSDNFDFQTKDDFVKGLLINEEILGSTIYCNIKKGSNYGAAITSWRMYQTISHELQNNWIYPIAPSINNRLLKNKVVIGQNSTIGNYTKISNSVIGENVKIGHNVEIQDSFILNNCKIDDGVIITHSVIGGNCALKSKSRVTAGCILGQNVVIEKEQFVENALVQSSLPESCEEKDKLSEKAYRIQTDEEEDRISELLSKKLSRLHINDNYDESDIDTFTDSEDDELFNTNSPIPDDTKLFFTEVIDSLTRGFEDELQCDNLILEINSSRYAYNVTVKEVNFNVIKAILHMSLRLPIGQQYFSQFVRLLSYFSPILKNYIRNDSAMVDALQAIEDVALSSELVTDKWIMFVLKWFYDKDYISEEAILKWSKLLEKESQFYSQVKPFTDWLQEAEEESSDDEDD